MSLGAKRSKAGLLILALAACALAAGACRDRDETPGQESVPVGEPDEYSATVILTVEDGAGRRVFVTRVARRGGMFRQDWSEQGESRALIHRPDIGKSFLLFPDSRTYTESEADQSPVATGESGDDLTPDQIDRLFDGAPPPARVTARALPDQTLEGYSCAVTEEHATLEDGRTEVTRLFRARDLAGLALRVEVESDAVKVVTERRDIETLVPTELFNIPEGFRKVARGSPR